MENDAAILLVGLVASEIITSTESSIDLPYIPKRVGYSLAGMLWHTPARLAVLPQEKYGLFSAPAA
jgi:hypothetical protein